MDAELKEDELSLPADADVLYHRAYQETWQGACESSTMVVVVVEEEHVIRLLLYSMEDERPVYQMDYESAAVEEEHAIRLLLYSMEDEPPVY